MDRNNLVYDPAAQMYRQNPLDPNGAAFGQMDGVSGAVTDQPVEAGPQQNYPEWLTNLSARGLASDWLPAAFVPTPADELQSRIIPPDSPVAAQTAPMSASTNAAFSGSNNGGGQEGGGDASNGAGSNNDPSSPDSGTGSSASDANAGSSSDASGGVGSSGDSGSSGGGAGDASGGSADAGSDGGFSRGGIVSPNKLVGPNPPGPDTGFGALKPGEGVLTDKAMKFYGKGIVAKLNKLAVPKEIFR